MAIEKFANNATTSLDGAINNSTTTVVVIDASSFPTTGNFRIIIESEIMLVTAVSSNTFTVTRGVEGTSAVSHANSLVVNHILTAAAMDAFRSDNFQVGAYASLPAAAKAGRVYIPNDSHYNLIYDNGSAWEYYVRGIKATPLVGATFTWLNQGATTATDSAGGVYLSRLCNTTTNEFSGKYKSMGSAPWTVTVHIRPNLPEQNFVGYALFFRESSSGKLHVFSIQHDTVWKCCSRKMTNESTFSADYMVSPQIPMEWLRIQDNNTNRIISVSADGVNWKNIHTVGRTDFLTANQAGFAIGCERQTGGFDVTTSYTLDSWTES
jgi:hypothetical protein